MSELTCCEKPQPTAQLVDEDDPSGVVCLSCGACGAAHAWVARSLFDAFEEIANAPKKPSFDLIDALLDNGKAENT